MENFRYPSDSLFGYILRLGYWRYHPGILLDVHDVSVKHFIANYIDMFHQEEWNKNSDIYVSFHFFYIRYSSMQPYPGVSLYLQGGR